MSEAPASPPKTDKDDTSKKLGHVSTREKRFTELKLEIPSPDIDRIASISMSASGSSGSSKLLRVDERLHRWLEEEALQVSSPKGISKVAAGQSMRLHAKLLVSNSAAGSIIGKVGVNIHQTQLQTGAKVQLSKANQYFPGTIERTLLVKGNLSQIISALYSIYVRLIDENAAPILREEEEEEEKVGDEGAVGEGEGRAVSDKAEEPKGAQDILHRVASSHLQVKMLVPDELCGIIVGKSGSTIKWCAETTNTSIRVLTRNPSVSGTLTHKIVTLRGHLVDILKAIAVFLLKQADDPEFTSYGHIPRTYVRAGFGSEWSGVVPFAPQYPYATYPAAVPYSPAASPFTSMAFTIIPQHQPIVVRNFIQYAHYIQQMTGVFMKLEPSLEEGRLVVRFQGPQEQINQARGLLSQLLSCSTDIPGTFEQPRFSL
ncbi:Protein BTR1 [Picochlorum sp. SENEW3]|nr:Protein BTR1 [Picochlorum sp. SENEW3]